MIIGEAPRKNEDKTGHPFVGPAGRYLGPIIMNPPNAAGLEFVELKI